MSLPAIAVAGAGMIGGKHAAVLAAGPGARLAGRVDPAPAADAVAARFGVPRVASRDALTGIDGVIPATPTALHVPQAPDCIRIGLPVRVEKPVAASVVEAAVRSAASGRTETPQMPW
jgi:predicted dehydrogenase